MAKSSAFFSISAAPYLPIVPLCIIFCRTSLILSCRAALVGNRSPCCCWNTVVTLSDGKYPWSWNSWITTLRRWSTGFLWEERVGLLGSCCRRSPLSSLSPSFRPPCSRAATSASASRLGILLALSPTAWHPSTDEPEAAFSREGFAICDMLLSATFSMPPATWPRLVFGALCWPSRPCRWWGVYSGSSANCLSKFTSDRTLWNAKRGSLSLPLGKDEIK